MPSVQSWFLSVTEDKESELQAPSLSVPHLIARECELRRAFTAGKGTERLSLGLEVGNVSWARAADQWEEAGTWDTSSLQHEQALG